MIELTGILAVNDLQKFIIKPKVLIRDELIPKGLDIYPRVFRLRLRQPFRVFIKYKYMVIFLYVRRLVFSINTLKKFKATVFYTFNKLEKRLREKRIKQLKDIMLVLFILLSIYTGIFLLFEITGAGASSFSLFSSVPGTVSFSEDRIFFKIDESCLLFIIVVSLVGAGAQLYSLSYMSNDYRQAKFCFLLFCFTALIILLVISENFWFFFIVWELIGLVSFFLINFWSARAEANLSGEKAVVANRVCDLSLFLCFVFFSLYGANNFTSWLTIPADAYSLSLVVFIFSSTGKSAQFGFHGWLLNAMEGPTPVSALMHAATLVTAGAILLLKASSVLTFYNPAILLIGGLTALFCGVAACFESDIKAIIAYSTAGQIGFIFIWIGCSQPELAFMHLSNHAVFKSLLFFSAGLVIHSFHTQYSYVAGLQTAAPIAAAALIISVSCLIGVPFSSGFFSKEFIIVTPFSLIQWHQTLLLILCLLIQGFSWLYNVRTVWLLLFCNVKTQILCIFKGVVNYLFMQIVVFTFSVIAVLLGWLLNMRASALYQSTGVFHSRPALVGLNITVPSSYIYALAGVFFVALFVFLSLVGLGKYPSVPVCDLYTQFYLWKKNTLRLLSRILYGFFITLAQGATSSTRMYAGSFRETTLDLPLHVILLERIRFAGNEAVDFFWKHCPVIRVFRLWGDAWFVFRQVLCRYLLLMPLTLFVNKIAEFSQYHRILFENRTLKWTPLMWYREPASPMLYAWYWDFDLVHSAPPFWRPFKELLKDIFFHSHFIIKPEIPSWVWTHSDLLNSDMRSSIGQRSWAQISHFWKTPMLIDQRRCWSFYFTTFDKWFCPWEEFKTTKYRKIHYLIYLLVAFSTINYEGYEFFNINDFFYHIAFWTTCFYIHVYSKNWVRQVRQNRKNAGLPNKNIIWEI